MRVNPLVRAWCRQGDAARPVQDSASELLLNRVARGSRDLAAAAETGEGVVYQLGQLAAQRQILSGKLVEID